MGKEKFIVRLFWLFFLILLIFNFFTALTPEIGFDALWYHLTLPKLWLFKHQWYFPGGLLYYSAMPRLTELIFTPLISGSGFVGPKLFQLISGLGTCFVIYQITKQFGFKQVWRITAVNLFYLTWLVSWQSGSAYIDLFRTLLENLALLYLLRKKRYIASVFLGLAIGTKLLSLGSLVILALVFGFDLLPIALLVASPWFLISYYFTQNPIYPIFSNFFAHQNPNIFLFLRDVIILPYKITFPFDDFISPVAGLLVSLSALNYLFEKDKNIQKISLLAVLGALFSVFLNPPSSRFFLPYLPAAAIGAVSLINKLKPVIQKWFIYLFISAFVIIIFLRLVAFQKNIPFILRQQTVNQYLTGLSYKLPGTFIDSDDFVKNNLQGQKILIDKLHNLFYFPYDFDHTSWVDSQTGYDYLVTTETDPKVIKGNLIHTNSVGIQIYKLR